MRTALMGLAVVSLLVTSAAAQSPATSYTAKFYLVGATSPIQSTSFAASAAVCNQAPLATTNTVNPTKLEWADESTPGKVCVATVAPGDPLFALPLGSFEGTLSAVNAAGSSDESARAPFSRDAVRKAPTAFALVR